VLNLCAWARVNVCAEFQDPASTDTVERIKRDMYEAEKVLQKNVASILERGQKLEDLIAQSEQLSLRAKMMYKSVNQSPGWFEDCCGIV
jgi:synaptobrevin family protein YKT6